MNSFVTFSKFHAGFKAALFGALLATIVAILGSNIIEVVSPFASTALALISGATVMVLGHLRALWLGEPLNKAAIIRSIFAGILFSFGMFFCILGLHLGAPALGAVVILSLSPTLSLISRKVLWGEHLGISQRFGSLLSLAVAALWLVLEPSKNITSTQLAFTSLFLGQTHFLPLTFVFFGVVFWSLALSVTRPSECSSPTGAYWAWVAIFASVVGIPLMAWGESFLGGSATQAANVISHSAFLKNPILLFSYMGFGIIALFCRVALLSRSSLFLPSGVLAYAWVFSALVVSCVFAGIQNQHLTWVHFISIPLHILGLSLARNAFKSWAPYTGPTEIVSLVS